MQKIATPGEDISLTMIDARPEYPWVVKIILTSLDQKYFEIVIKVGETSGHHATTAPSSTDDDIELIR